MNIIALIIINSYSQLIPVEDSIQIQEKILEYSNDFKYNIGISTEQSLNIFITNHREINYNTAKNFFINNNEVLFKQFYSKEEQDIITAFHLVYCLPELIYDSEEYATFLESFLNITSSKEELTYCIEEIKYRLATYYIVKGIKLDVASQLIQELEQIEDRHNATNIFAEKETT